MSLYIGIDIGGTTVKGGVFDDGRLIYENSVPTDAEEELADLIDGFVERLVSGASKVFSEIAGVGVGCPGVIDSENGTVVFAANLRLKNYPLGKLLAEKLGIPVRLCNDANAAALGEAKAGAGKDYEDSITVTLGTGVGGGIVIGGKLYEGYKSAGAEIGHMVIERGGDKCSCGRYGCFEAYCSARALTRRTRLAMEDDTSSDMWKNYTYETADGRAAFECMDNDRAARQVVDWYLKYLSCGIANLANIFRPQAIIIGGGVAAQGARLVEPLQKLVDAELFAGSSYAPVEICCAKLGTKAGIYGAAALFD